MNKYPIVCVLLATACSGQGNELDESNSHSAEQVIPHIDVDEHGQPYVDTPEDIAAVERMYDELGIQRVSPEHPVMIDDLDEQIEENRLTAGLQVESDEVEKGAITAITGWALRGTLAYQDGVETSDHCRAFGLTCDNEWHAQARKTSYDGLGSTFKAEVLGLCGNSGRAGGGTADWAWLPCLFRQMTGAPDSIGRTMRWRYIDTNCGTTEQKAHIRAAVIQALSYEDRYLGMNYTETTTGNWNVLFTCKDLPAGVTGNFDVRTNISLKAALADADGGVILQESCESDNLPGSSDPVDQYKQSIDMIYTYTQSEISLDVAEAFAAVSCTTSPTLIRRGLANILKHELGHDKAIKHHSWNEPSLGLMYRFAQSCLNITSYSQGHPENYVNAIKWQEHTHSTFGLDVFDDDLSCFRPMPDGR